MNRVVKGATVLLTILGAVSICVAQDKLRRVEQPSFYIYPNTPVSVEVKFEGDAMSNREIIAGPNWLHKLSLEVTNTSGKDIRFLRIFLVLRRATREAMRSSKPAPETTSVVITLEFPLSNSAEKILPSGERVTMKPGTSMVELWTNHLRKQGMEDIEKVYLDINRVGFTDGTSWVMGREYRQDP